MLPSPRSKYLRKRTESPQCSERAVSCQDRTSPPLGNHHNSAAIFASLVIVLMLRAVPVLAAGILNLDVPIPAP